MSLVNLSKFVVFGSNDPDFGQIPQILVESGWVGKR